MFTKLGVQTTPKWTLVPRLNPSGNQSGRLIPQTRIIIFLN